MCRMRASGYTAFVAGELGTSDAGAVMSRQATFEPALLRALLQACAQTCRLCGDECERHGQQGMEHCRICAEACRRGEQACNAVLSALQA